MKYYNNETNKIETLPPVIKTTSGGILFTKNLGALTLVTHGFYPVEYDAKPSRRYYTTEEVRELIDTTYRVTYTSVDKPVEGVKAKMVQDVTDKAKELFNQATAKYSTGEMALWSELENQAFDVLYLPDEQTALIDSEAEAMGVTSEARATKVIDKAQAFKALRLYIITNRTLKINEIEALTTIAECIEYERSSYEESVEDPETGEVTQVTMYRNKCKDWV